MSLSHQYSWNRHRFWQGSSGSVLWWSQNSIADSSTTNRLIFDPLSGCHWAQCQLHAGIRYVSVASILMKSPPLLTVVFRLGTLVIPELNGRFLHDCLTDFDSVTWTLGCSTPATLRYRIHLSHINTHEVAVYSRGGTKKAEGDSGDLRTPWPIPPPPPNQFRFCHLDVVGLNASYMPI